MEKNNSYFNIYFFFKGNTSYFQHQGDTEVLIFLKMCFNFLSTEICITSYVCSYSQHLSCLLRVAIPEFLTPW